MKDLSIAFEGIVYTEYFTIEHLTYISIILWLITIISISSLLVKFLVSRKKLNILLNPSCLI